MFNRYLQDAAEYSTELIVDIYMAEKGKLKKKKTYL